LRRRGRLIAIEQVTQSDLGRGGTVVAYEQMFVEAGLRVLDVSMIRVSDSRILGLAQRFPILAGLPIVPRLMTREATRRGNLPLTDGRYADALFRATKAAG